MTNENSMSQLLDAYDVKTISRGDVIEGTVIDVNEKEVKVNINYAFDGVITRGELTKDEVNPLDVVKEGDKINVLVLSPNDGEGYVLLSRRRVVEKEERAKFNEELKKDKEKVSEAFKNGTNLTVEVKDEIKGGVAAYFGKVRVFIPGSLLSREKVKFKDFVGKDLELRITELDFKNNKIVGSRKAIEEEIFQKEQEEIWNSLVEGEKRKGVVKNTTKFGAFVDIGGVQGLVHINDLAWERVKRVEDIVKTGDEVEVLVASVDRDANRISLVLKEKSNEPWTLHGDSIKSGDVLDGKVVKLKAFGAFVEVFPGIQGLVHLSEITDENIAKPEEVLNVGQKVKVKVLDINKEDRKLSLSIKEATEKSKEYQEFLNNEDDVTLGEVFGNLKDMFK